MPHRNLILAPRGLAAVGVVPVNIPAPNAPSLVCLNRHTGLLVWSDNSPGQDNIHGQWSSPAHALDPVPQVNFGGGDGWLRAFDPPTGRLL